MTHKVNDQVLFNGEAAIVTAVNADGSVNLRVFHASGIDSAPAGVMLPGDVPVVAVEPAPTEAQPVTDEAAGTA